MQRSFLRRYIERLALVSLPLLGAAACGSDGAPAPAADLAVAVVLDQDDLGCPQKNDGCDWLTYVDGGTPTDNPAYWFPDGGVNPCGPCGFEGTHGIYCGQCQVVHNSCGTAYFCSVTDCTLACAAGAGSGRRPPGLQPPSLAGAGLAHALVRMAHLEAASVPAFAQLAAELAAHRAPERLIAGARRALADEERHARVVGELARAAGARPLPLDVAPTPLRPLVEVARENAVEGCVRETAGAVVAARQARAFADPRLARIFAAIAADERRHANLAWAVDDWARPRLSPAERRSVDAARAAAVRDLAG